MNYRCPVCQKELRLEGKSWKCSQGHSFDIAKSGYVNLAVGKSAAKLHGDNQLMVKARCEFLENNPYACLVNKLIELIKPLSPSVLIDAGCGEGYYTRQIQEALKQTQVFGFDLSKDAILYASKKDSLTHYAISSIFNLPMPDCCANVIISLFAPVALDEFHRLLAQSGILMVVTPGEKHLWGLKDALYDTPYLNELSTLEDDRFQTLTREWASDIITLKTQAEINNLFMMTPYYYKTSLQDKKKLEELSSLTTPIEFSIQIFKKR